MEMSDKSLQGFIRELTSTDDNELDSGKLKKLKYICKSYPERIPHVSDFIIKRMSRSTHCQIRLLCFKVLDHLFRRSSVVRSIVVSKLKIIISLTFGLSSDKPLPPPDTTRKILIKLARRTFGEWTTEFKDKYPKLESTSIYLKEHCNCDVYYERRESHESSLKMTRLWRDHCRNVVNEMNDKKSYIEEVCIQLQNAIDLIIPSSFVADEEDGDKIIIQDDEDFMRDNGVINLNKSVAVVDLSIPSFINQENEVLVDLIIEQTKVLRNRLIPLVIKWTTIFEKSEQYVSEFTHQRGIAENVRSKLVKLEDICTRLIIPKKRITNIDSDDDDDEFEEVPDKEGYEESYQEPSSSSKIEPWKDIQLLKKLEAATGQKLIFDKQRKKRKLTPLSVDKSRKRLEKIVFNRSSLKRVREDIKSNLINSSKRVIL
uniref:Uncharacterized protein KIAA1530like [Monodelphis domestica] n=1 Tax=Lepeophtheirus salmonis TaxID=72036 RepID=A0A0K2TM96_LEPSM